MNQRLLCVLGLALAACGNHADHADASDDFLLGGDVSSRRDTTVVDATPTDGTVGTDGAVGEAGADGSADAGVDGDAARTDGDAATDVVVTDTGPVGTDPCPAAIDLATAGSRSGDTLTYTGSTATTDATGTVPAVCVASVTHELALRYTVAARSHLRVSTANGGTASTFDTVAWALNTCSASGTSLGCADDSTPGDHRSTFTTSTAFDAGATVYLFVAGYLPARPDMTTSGAFALSVTEVPETATGGSCDPSSDATVCASGANCIGSGTTGTCIADGSRGGRCRAAPPGCDTGSGCNGDRLSTSSRCVTQIAPGEVCDPTMQMNVCAAGTSCVLIVAGTDPICT